MQIPTTEQIIKILQDRYLGFVDVAFEDPPDWLIEEKYGNYPKTFYLIQYASRDTGLEPNCNFADRDRICAWTIEREKVTTLDPDVSREDLGRRHYPDTEAIEGARRKMFWTYGLAEFAYNPESGLLQNSYMVGSRNGGSGVFNLQLDSKGEIKWESCGPSLMY